MANYEDARLQTERRVLQTSRLGYRLGASLRRIFEDIGIFNVGDGAWPSCYFHKGSDPLRSVSLDELKLVGPVQNRAKGWLLIASSLELDPPQPLSLYLGCIHGWKDVKAGA